MVVDSLSPCVLDPQDDTCDSGFKCVPIAKPAMLTSPVLYYLKLSWEHFTESGNQLPLRPEIGFC